ncbi:hypothetical protein AAV35_14150 [Salimicrobium jeotgali]|uniref:ABC transporter domain-containing protein n=1 Tax=Salimicrobium jeotgali TaxID=1230341 RepID=A0AAC9J4T1_9BACI|nr:ATP-binding cassette domain-containing protein [Salimicrobium jeotgali]APC65580.1 hypothetical protein AAV35_14150 [Salimicrobium jeotgali]MBM7697681.1 ATPase subunit of ABC transporter with duplicated ATPase domains [Salimicrobium jeotgali]
MTVPIYGFDKDSFIFQEQFEEETQLGEWYRNSNSLSGGQWQKIGLYRLIYREAYIYLLDEPTNNLDKKALENFKDFLDPIRHNSLIIIVSHDEHFLAQNCTEIYEMSENGMTERGEVFVEN